MQVKTAAKYIKIKDIRALSRGRGVAVGFLAIETHVRHLSAQAARPLSPVPHGLKIHPQPHPISVSSSRRAQVPCYRHLFNRDAVPAKYREVSIVKRYFHGKGED